MFEPKNDKVIFLDIDDTLADTRRAVLSLYEQMEQKKAGSISTKSKSYTGFCPNWTQKNIKELFEEKASILYDTVLPMEGSREAVSELINLGYDVRVASTQHPKGAYAKYKWIKKYFPELKDKICFVTYNCDKNFIKEWAIIDDDFSNIEKSKCAYPILLDMYDIYSDLDYDYRVRNWRSALAKLK